MKLIVTHLLAGGGPACGVAVDIDHGYSPSIADVTCRRCWQAHMAERRDRKVNVNPEYRKRVYKRAREWQAANDPKYRGGPH